MNDAISSRSLRAKLAALPRALQLVMLILAPLLLGLVAYHFSRSPYIARPWWLLLILGGLVMLYLGSLALLYWWKKRQERRQIGADEIMKRTFADYQLIKRLGEGGMGEVYTAKKKGAIEIIHALKLIPIGHMALDDKIQRKILKEPQILSRLNHPNIIKIVDTGIANHYLFIAMEYIHGRDLEKIVRELRAKQEVFPLKYAIRIMISICAGLDYAVAELTNFIHRDIKPANIIIGFQGEIKLLDFGVAKAQDFSLSAQNSGRLSGTIPYMSPEQIQGKNCDFRSDIFSLGSVFYYLITGSRPFNGQTPHELMIQICCQEPLPPSKLRQEVDPELEVILQKALAKEPENRYSRPREMLENLANYCERHGIVTNEFQLAKFMKDTFALSDAGLMPANEIDPSLTDDDEILLANKISPGQTDDTITDAIAIKRRPAIPPAHRRAVNQAMVGLVLLLLALLIWRRLSLPGDESVALTSSQSALTAAPRPSEPHEVRSQNVTSDALNQSLLFLEHLDAMPVRPVEIANPLTRPNTAQQPINPPLAGDLKAVAPLPAPKGIELSPPKIVNKPAVDLPLAGKSQKSKEPQKNMKECPLSLSLTPANSQIFLDDTPLANSRMLPSGRYTMSFRSPNHIEQNHPIECHAGKPIRLSVTLAQANCPLTVRADRPAVRLTLDGQPQIRQNQKFMSEVTPGPHTLEFSQPDHASSVQTIQCQNAESIELESAHLKRLRGDLRIETEPAGARIILNGQVQSANAPTIIPNLATATTYRLSLELAGYRNYQQDISLDLSVPTTIVRVTLTQSGINIRFLNGLIAGIVIDGQSYNVRKVGDEPNMKAIKGPKGLYFQFARLEPGEHAVELLPTDPLRYSSKVKKVLFQAGINTIDITSFLLEK
jgi:serine/threonine protein kinase